MNSAKVKELTSGVGFTREKQPHKNNIPKLEEPIEGFLYETWTKSSVLARDKQLAKLLDDAPEHEHRYSKIAGVECTICEVLSVLKGETKGKEICSSCAKERR